MICASAQVSQLDDELAVAYRAVLQISPARMHEVRTEQRNWVTSQRDKCADASCLAQTYQDRITSLNAVLNASNQPQSASNAPATASSPATPPALQTAPQQAHKLAGGSILGTVSRDNQARQSRAEALAQIFKGYPAMAVDVFDISVNPDPARPNFIAIDIGYRLNKAFIESLKTFAEQHSCEENDKTCKMEICLGYGRVNCVPIAGGPLNSLMQYPILERIQAPLPLTYGSLNYMGFAVRFLNAGGARAGSGWCADLYTFQANIEPMLHVNEPSGSRGYLTAYVNRDYKTRIEVDLRDLTKTVDVDAAAGVVASAFTYGTGGQTFDITDMTKPLPVALNPRAMNSRGSHYKRSVLFPPKDIVGTCGWVRE